MSIDKAAKATRRYCVEHHREWSGKTNNGLNFGILIGLGWRWLATSGEAQAACDRLNLLAVLEALREPSEGMLKAAPASDLKTKFGALYVWRAMIDGDGGGEGGDEGGGGGGVGGGGGGEGEEF